MAEPQNVINFPTQTRRARRVNSWRWNELEDDTLDALPQEAQIIYLRVIRKNMDYETGITGRKRLISYGEMKERLRYVPPAGSRTKLVEYTTEQIKNFIRKLVKAGLIEPLHDTSKGVAPMVFFLPLACSDVTKHDHGTNTGGEPRENPHSRASGEGNSNTGEPREENHPSGVRFLSELQQQPCASDEFRMDWDWQPSEYFATELAMRNPTLTQYLDEDLLTEFRTYWMGQRHALTQNQWEGKLVNSLTRRKADLAAKPTKAMQDAETGIPPCPHESILAAWNDELGALKGTAPALVDWLGSRPAVELEARWRESFNAKNPSGHVRYHDTESGAEWFRHVFRKLCDMGNFRQSDVDVFKLFYKETFSRATKGKLRQQSGGAVR